MLKQVCHNASIRLYHNPVFLSDLDTSKWKWRL